MPVEYDVVEVLVHRCYLQNAASEHKGHFGDAIGDDPRDHLGPTGSEALSEQAAAIAYLLGTTVQPPAWRRASSPSPGTMNASSAGTPTGLASRGFRPARSSPGVFIAARAAAGIASADVVARRNAEKAASRLGGTVFGEVNRNSPNPVGSRRSTHGGGETGTRTVRPSPTRRNQAGRETAVAAARDCAKPNAARPEHRVPASSLCSRRWRSRRHPERLTRSKLIVRRR